MEEHVFEAYLREHKETRAFIDGFDIEGITLGVAEYGVNFILDNATTYMFPKEIAGSIIEMLNELAARREGYRSASDRVDRVMLGMGSVV